jgi:uncharacterized protein (DUF1800 family)
MRNMPLRFRFVAVLVLAAAVAGGTRPAAEQRNSVPVRPDGKTVTHVLNRLGFGPSRASLERVRRMGLAAYIDEQLHPEKIDDRALAVRLERLSTLTMSTRELAEDYYLPAMIERREQQRRSAQSGAGQTEQPSSGQPPARTPEQMQLQRQQRTPIAELSEQKILRAVYSERQLEEALVDFWFNHFNVFVGKGQVRLYLTEYERDAIRPHVLGKFRDLLGATAHSPAMLFYLDNWQSTAAEGAPTAMDPRPRRDAAPRPAIRRRPGLSDPRRRPQEPQSIAVRQPQPMRRRGLNENYARELMELHTLGVDGGYTQKDVQEVARAFTGWTISTPRLGGSFRFEPSLHDSGEKVVIGHRIKAGGGEQDGEQVLDILARHPSTARFIATKLARRFIADDPPAALVARAAARFKETDGNLREVVRAIVTSEELFAPQAYRAKVKSPLEFVVSAVRVTDLDMVSALPLVQSLRDLGMPLYGAQPPTGYADRAETWVNSGALLNRMNFAVALTSGRLRGRGAQTPPTGTANSVDDARALIGTALAGDISENTSATVARATTAPQAAALILGSPEFQKR